MAVGPWDVALLIAVSIQATVLAYIHTARRKALLYALPVPFTVASLALQIPINTTHALGILLLPLYPNIVRWLRCRVGLHIVSAIGVACLVQGIVSLVLVCSVPVTDTMFWLTLSMILVCGSVLNRVLPQRLEAGHRSPLPVVVKFVLVAVVVTCLIALKRVLQGFMATFPMVGVLAAYEARHSLWTLGRQIPVFMLAMVPLLGVARLLQDGLGLGPALLAGWAAFLLVLTVLTRRLWLRTTECGGAPR